MKVDNIKPEMIVSSSPFDHSAQNDVYLQAYKNNIHLLSKALGENVTKFHIRNRAHRFRRPFRGMKSSELPR